MKIIKKAIKLDSVQIVCESCGSILEVTENDVNVRDYGINGTYYAYTCPVCNSTNCDDNLEKLFKYTLTE